MRIGVITTSYPRFAGDAAGQFVAGHVGALRALGHGVEVIAAGAPIAGEPVVRIGGGVFYRGGAPDALERTPLRAGASAVAFTARMTATVIARAPRWDAIIAHWLVPSALAALPTSPPLLAIVHGGDLYTLRRLGLLRAMLHALRRRDARLVFVSESLRAVAQRAVPGLAPWLATATVQPMGLDVERFAQLGRAPSDPPIVLVVARLVPIKGVDIAIAAMPHVRCAARLVIAGDGPERARLAALPGPTVFVGQISTVRRDDLLRTAGVVVIPSRVLPSGRTEGTPTIALEALAAGVPVIASAVGGLCDVPGVRLVAPDDPQALAGAIDQVLARPPTAESLRAGVAGLAWREVIPHLIRE